MQPHIFRGDFFSGIFLNSGILVAARAISEIIPELVRYFEAFIWGGGFGVLRILSHIDIASDMVDRVENSGIGLGKSRGSMELIPGISKVPSNS